MRSSGYRDTAHALAELIDNSVQSGEIIAGCTEVELICIDAIPEGGGRRKLSRIAVFDNSSGMDPRTLRTALQFGNGSHLEAKDQKGIGKFGMGLPNSSISQCKRVDVWSWKKGIVYHSYLDVSAIEKEVMIEIPEPEISTIPSEWLGLIAGAIAPHGTLIVWSQLDRVSWKQSSTLLRHAEFIVGRVYRHFINNKSVRVRLAAYDHDQGYKSLYETFVKPNDPLYLMTGTNSPAPFNQKAAFEVFGGPQVITIGFEGKDHEVVIKASVCLPEARKEGGPKPIGQHALKNQGISVVRAERELEMNHTFLNTYDSRERWWGIEVNFPPSLDNVFGVTNNKQAATGFMRMSLEEDAELEGMSINSYREMLELDRDPRLPMYRISREIEKLLSGMRARVAKLREGERVEKKKENAETKAEKAATESVNRRRDRVGDTGRSDKQEEASTNERTAALTTDIVQDGVESAKAHEIAVDYVTKKIKFRFKHGEVAGNAIFDIAVAGGVILVTLNTRHPAHIRIFEVLRDDDAVENPYARQILSLIAAWARMEDEAPSEKMRKSIEDARSQWGRMAMDFFEEEVD